MAGLARVYRSGVLLPAIVLDTDGGGTFAAAWYLDPIYDLDVYWWCAPGVPIPAQLDNHLVARLWS